MCVGGSDGYKQLEFRPARHQTGPAHALHRGRGHQHLPGAAPRCDAVLHCAGQVVCSQLEHSVMAVFTTGRSPETELVADLLNTFQAKQKIIKQYIWNLTIIFLYLTMPYTGSSLLPCGLDCGTAKTLHLPPGAGEHQPGRGRRGRGRPGRAGRAGWARHT